MGYETGFSSYVISYGNPMSQHRPLANFYRLLAAWNHHQDLRHRGAPIAELAASRADLDMIRRAG